MRVYTEEELLPISALQHLAYCPRQCALIHLEQVWAENRYTAEGNLLHARADAGKGETRGDCVTARGLRLHSFALGLAGIADVVEFQRIPAGGCQLAGRQGLWKPHPVEYKRGRPKGSDCDQVQLCAQAICLEEMLGTEVMEGSLFYGKTRRRTPVCFDSDLRGRTQLLADELHTLWEEGRTPMPEYGTKCERCSLQSLCQPRLFCDHDVEAYLHRVFDDENGT